MRKISQLLSVVALTCCFSSLQAQTQSTVNMLTKARSAVVNIRVIDKAAPASHDPRLRQPMSQIGTGVIVDGRHGLIVTNAHVLEHHATIIITLKDGQRYHANVVGLDKNFDLAVIHISAHNLPTLPTANSSHVHVGDHVYAIGSPFGLQQTVTSGVISAINRTRINNSGNIQSYIQTDAPINMGNSGGALINDEGQLIGINTAIITPNAGNIGIGFAIPSNTAKAAAKQLIEFGKIKKGSLGVTLQTLTPDLANALKIKAKRGALLSTVVPETPAASAGLAPLDVITDANEWAIKTSTDLADFMGLTAPGSDIKFSIVRGSKHMTLTATAGDKKDLAHTPTLPFLSGMQLENSSSLSPTALHVRSGVRVIGTLASSEGAIAGLLGGDLILAANTQKIYNLKRLLSVAKKADQHMLLKVERRGQIVYLVLSKDR